MHLAYRLLADLTVVVHAAYVLFVIFGLLAVFIGYVRRWTWIRNLWFRILHLLMIAVVVAEAQFGMTCPLTTWEQRLRTLAGQQSYHGDFIANLVHDLLFFDAEPWVFTLCYTLFGLVVAATFWLAPPLWPVRAKPDAKAN
jgi:hypothetical protein